MFTNIFQELDFGTDFLVATINTYIIFSGFLLEIVLLNLKLFPREVKKKLASILHFKKFNFLVNFFAQHWSHDLLPCENFKKYLNFEKIRLLWEKEKENLSEFGLQVQKFKNNFKNQYKNKNKNQL